MAGYAWVIDLSDTAGRESSTRSHPRRETVVCFTQENEAHPLSHQGGIEGEILCVTKIGRVAQEAFCLQVAPENRL